ncbi:MAG: type I-U CRISPR-associated protein Cas7 [Acidobacteria bacterium]|nr:type I-U CRISPR-associated RAMP protein Csb1/Cas7u [Bryobacterales bacterium]MYD84952.1 type I-U CRISPR-associated protein Cas7 [Acidobacteriota bacterium]MYH22861.1 type I-U CRISPR-associated protein Cas7 [Acidobacteriota bacterium]MYK80112.1 type I-U CRISPR-associated protein Cas7 [Acidobacteriota bacterium]
MPRTIDLETLLNGCADTCFDDGVRIDAQLEPISGPGGPVKPAVYEGGTYQHDKRWASPTDENPTPVIVIDNVPSQANRLEDALRRHRESTGVPEFVLDLSSIPNLPPHLPKQISSLQFPHRNADAYLRDALLNDQDFLKTDLGLSIFSATASECGPLIAWFPQALIYGFWQSHLGKKRANTKHARAWVSEIIGWNPAETKTRSMGLKGDPLNLSTDAEINSNSADRVEWSIGKGSQVEGGKSDRLSNIGHGQVPFRGEDATAAPVSFARITQRSTVSFAQLRRVSLGPGGTPAADAAGRALLLAMGLCAHAIAFGGGLALRSGAELRTRNSTATWLGAEGDEVCELGGAEALRGLLAEALERAAEVGVPLDGWGAAPVVLTPKDNLRKAIRETWPDLDS